MFSRVLALTSTLHGRGAALFIPMYALSLRQQLLFHRQYYTSSALVISMHAILQDAWVDSAFGKENLAEFGAPNEFLNAAKHVMMSGNRGRTYMLNNNAHHSEFFRSHGPSAQDAFKCAYDFLFRCGNHATPIDHIGYIDWFRSIVLTLASMSTAHASTE